MEKSDKWDSFRKVAQVDDNFLLSREKFLELLDERDKLAREALMREGLISGLHADREFLRNSLAHVIGELSMFDHGEPEGAFEDCAECEAARQLLTHD